MQQEQETSSLKRHNDESYNNVSYNDCEQENPNKKKKACSSSEQQQQQLQENIDSSNKVQSPSILMAPTTSSKITNEEVKTNINKSVNIKVKYGTPLPSTFYNDPYLWLDKQLNKNLKDCFNERLDKPYIQDYNKDNITGFYNRESFTSRAQRLVLKNIKHFFNNKQRGDVGHYEFSYGILTNGPGSGKTRACREFQNVILQMPISHDESNTTTTTTFRKLHCYFPLNNGYDLNAIEKTIDPILDASDGKIVGLRLLCTIYGLSVYEFTNAVGSMSIFDLIYKDTTLFNLANVVKKLSTFLNDEILLLSIAIDDIHVLMNHFEERVWKYPIHSIGRYMVDSMEPNHNLKYNVCLIPIISGIVTDEQIQFRAYEYGNCIFSLPPLSILDMNDIISDYFKNWKFKCGTLLTEAFTTFSSNKNIVHEFYIKIIEGLLVPNVLIITLREIATILECISFQEWNSLNSSLTLLSTIKQHIEQAIEKYLPTTINTQYIGDLSTLKKLLSCQPINLDNNTIEKKQFNKGRLYSTFSQVLYLSTHYFHQLLQSHDYFIYCRLLPLGGDGATLSNLKQIDLKCICRRFDYYQSIKQSSCISLEQLFPGSIYGGKSIELCFYLPKPHKDVEYNLTVHSPFIIPMRMKGNNEELEELENNEILDEIGDKIIFNVKANECKVEPYTIYMVNDNNTTKLNQSTSSVVDGHFCLKDDYGNCIFLIKYKFDGLEKSELNPITWLEQGNFAKRVIESFKNNMKVYFVYITTNILSMDELEMLKHSEYFKQFILIYHTNDSNNSPVVKYFPSNLLPYYMMSKYTIPPTTTETQ